MPFGTPFPCLQVEQVLIRLVSFPPTLRVVSFTISVHEGTTKLFPVFKRLFYFSPFCFCRSIFFLFHCVTLHPHRISISELHFVSAGAAGKSLWWIPFRDSCMLFHSLFWSMQGNIFYVLLILVSPFVPFLFHVVALHIPMTSPFWMSFGFLPAGSAGRSCCRFLFRDICMFIVSPSRSIISLR